MALIPYLNFNGNAKEAILYYTEAFKLEAPEIMYFKEMPADQNFPINKENGELVMHGSIQIEGEKIMFSDTIEEMGGPVKFGDNLAIMYNSKDLEVLKERFTCLSEGGKVTMPFCETFWSKGYGMLIDKFGISWQFNLDEEID